jgi:hypothetical protein
MESSSPARSRDDCCGQAVAKAEAVTANAARLVRAPTLCVCNAPGEEDLAARMLLVRSGSAPGAGRGARTSREAVAPAEACWPTRSVLCNESEPPRGGFQTFDEPLPALGDEPPATGSESRLLER